MEGLFGVKMGSRGQHVGVFAKVLPGFIYYESALPAAIIDPRVLPVSPPISAASLRSIPIAISVYPLT